MLKRILHRILGNILKEKDKRVPAAKHEWAALFENPAFWAIREQAALHVSAAYDSLARDTDPLTIAKAQGIVAALSWFLDDEQLAAECGGVDASASESERRTAMELVRRAFLVVNKEEAKETDE